MSWITTDYVKYPSRNLHFGHQKLSRDEINKVVDRLSLIKDESSHDHGVSDTIKKPRKLDQDYVDALVHRLSNETRTTRDDSNVINNKTVVNSYAWCDGKLLHFHLKPLDGTWH